MKLTKLLKEFKSQAYFNGNMKIGQVYSNPYARSFVNEEGDEVERESGLNLEQKQAFLEAVKSYKHYGESIYRQHADLKEVYNTIRELVEVAQHMTIDETQDWFDGVTVSRHMKRMNESFKVFEKTLKEVTTLQQRLESAYDEIGEVLGKYYEINEKLDPVGQEDGDIDNDGDEDASDEYLANRRKVVAKAIANESMKLTDMIVVLPDSEQKGTKTFKYTQSNSKFKSIIESVNEVDTKKANTIRKSMPGYVGPEFAKKASDEDILAMADLKDEKAKIYNRYLKDVMGKISNLQKKYNVKESVNEGVKRFYQRDGIGNAKYTVSAHDGVSKHKDGSDFYDIAIFKNKKDLEAYKKELISQGYRQDYGWKKESVNEERISSGNYSVVIGKTLDGFFGFLLVNTRGGKIGTVTGIRYKNKSRDEVVKWAEKELKKVSKEPIVKESVNEAEEKWTLFVDGKKVKEFKSRRAAVIAQNKYMKSNDDWKSVRITSQPSWSDRIPSFESTNESTKLTDILNEALAPKDKKVVQAFYNQKPLEGKLLNTDGRALVKLGMGGQGIANWSMDGSEIIITAKSDVRSTDAILRYMKKYIPSGLWSSKTPISNWI